MNRNVLLASLNIVLNAIFKYLNANVKLKDGTNEKEGNNNSIYGIITQYHIGGTKIKQQYSIRININQLNIMPANVFRSSWYEKSEMFINDKESEKLGFYELTIGILYNIACSFILSFDSLTDKIALSLLDEITRIIILRKPDIIVSSKCYDMQINPITTDISQMHHQAPQYSLVISYSQFLYTTQKIDFRDKGIIGAEDIIKVNNENEQ